MKKDRVLKVLVLIIGLTFTAMILLQNATFPMDRFGRPRTPIDPLGNLCQFLGILIVLVYPFNLLSKVSATKDIGLIKRLKCWFLNIHPYLAIIAIAIASIHMSFVLLSDRVWRFSEWTGMAALSLAVLIGLGGLSKFYCTGKVFSFAERSLHKWGSLVIVLIILFLHTK